MNWKARCCPRSLAAASASRAAKQSPMIHSKSLSVTATSAQLEASRPFAAMRLRLMRVARTWSQ